MVSERMCALHLLFWAVAEQTGQAHLRVLGCERSQWASVFLVSDGVWVPGSTLEQLAYAISDLGCPFTDLSLSQWQPHNCAAGMYKHEKWAWRVKKDMVLVLKEL